MPTLDMDDDIDGYKLIAFDDPDGEWGILSNSAPTPIDMSTTKFKKQRFPSVEHYLQYLRNPHDELWMKRIQLEPDPTKVQEMGVKFTASQRDAVTAATEWQTRVDDQLQAALKQKLKTYKEFEKALIDSERAFLAADTSQRNANIQDGYLGWKSKNEFNPSVGRSHQGNLLGILLMDMRDQINISRKNFENVIGQTEEVSHNIRDVLVITFPNQNLTDILASNPSLSQPKVAPVISQPAFSFITAAEDEPDSTSNPLSSLQTDEEDPLRITPPATPASPQSPLTPPSPTVTGSVFASPTSPPVTTPKAAAKPATQPIQPVVTPTTTATTQLPQPTPAKPAATTKAKKQKKVKKDKPAAATTTTPWWKNIFGWRGKLNVLPVGESKQSITKPNTLPADNETKQSTSTDARRPSVSTTSQPSSSIPLSRLGTANPATTIPSTTKAEPSTSSTSATTTPRSSFSSTSSSSPIGTRPLNQPAPTTSRSASLFTRTGPTVTPPIVSTVALPQADKSIRFNSDDNIEKILTSLKQKQPDNEWKKLPNETPAEQDVELRDKFDHNFTVQSDKLLTTNEELETFKAMLIGFKAVTPNKTPKITITETRLEAGWKQACLDTGIQAEIVYRPLSPSLTATNSPPPSPRHSP